jgi:hypothetical protein
MLLGAGLLADGLRQMSSPRFWKGAVAGLAAFVVLIRPELPLLDNYSSKKSMRAAGKSHVLRHGIKDEKKAYVYDRGLMTGHERFAPWLASRVELWKEQPRPEARRAVLVRCGGLGWRSFEYGPEADVYDLCALTDPFLSKLPLYDVGANQQLSSWAPGHFIRTEPDGYGESVATQQNLLLDPVLRDVYAAVQEVTTGPLWDWQRWRSIARLASLDLIFAARGAPTYLGTKYPKKQDTQVASYAFYSSPFRTDCMAEEPAEVTRGDGRELVLLENTAHSQSFKLTGTMHTEFRVILTAKNSEIYRFVLTPTNNCRQGLGIAAERLPDRVAERGFDAVIVEPVGIPGSSTVHFGGILLEGVDPGFISETEIRRLWAHDATAN